MAGNSKIQWTTDTWNPVGGCSKVSPGCKHCYALKIAGRFSAPGPYGHSHGLAIVDQKTKQAQWTGKLELFENRLLIPLRQRKPRRIFVNSMSDLFHENLPDAAIDRVYATMLLAPQHTFQVLTKRAARMATYLNAPGLYRRWLAAADRVRAQLPRLHLDRVPISDPEKFGPPRWIWHGVSVEDQRAADDRIPLLVQVRSYVRFLSVEPLLGNVTLEKWILPDGIGWQCSGCRGYFSGSWKEVCPTCGRIGYWTGSHAGNQRPNRQAIGWVIVGGESGNDARPMHPAWVSRIAAECASGQVPFFFKQWGAWKPDLPVYPTETERRELQERNEEPHEDAEILFTSGAMTGPVPQPDPRQNPWWMVKVGKKKAGDLMLDGTVHHAFPAEVTRE
jgi:protein gp37